MLYVEAPGTKCHNDNYKTYSTSSYLYYIRLYMQLACHYLILFATFELCFYWTENN